jgi:hypothetical protein
VKKAVVTYCYTVPPFDMCGDKKENLSGFPVYDFLGMTYPAAYPKMAFISDRIVLQWAKTVTLKFFRTKCSQVFSDVFLLPLNYL